MAASSIGSPTKLGPIEAWAGVDSGPPRGVERNGKGEGREKPSVRKRVRGEERRGK